MRSHARRVRTSEGCLPSIEPIEAESFAVVPGRADGGLILLCDHAGNAFPPGYGTLGLAGGAVEAPHRL